MVCHQVDNPLLHFFRKGKFQKKCSQQISAFRLLMIPVCIPVLLPAERTGNIMDNRRDLQGILSLLIQVLQTSDGLRVGIYFQKMPHVRTVSLIKINHLIYNSFFHASASCLHSVTKLISFRGRGAGFSSAYPTASAA